MSQKDSFEWLARVESKEIAREPRYMIDAPSSGSPVTTGFLTTDLVMPVDTEKERKRLQGEIDNLDGEIARAEQLLANEGFVTKAPGEVVCRERDKLARYQKERDKLKEKLGGLGE